jgi:23S rRNA-/tRNA-specific pseudouridylate synthase
MFRERTMAKEYLAMCAGVPRQKHFEVSNYLGPIDKKTGHVQSVRSSGKSAVTAFERLAVDTLSETQCSNTTARCAGSVPQWGNEVASA